MYTRSVFDQDLYPLSRDFWECERHALCVSTKDPNMGAICKMKSGSNLGFDLLPPGGASAVHTLLHPPL